MLPDWVSNPGPLTYKSGALLTALRGLAQIRDTLRIPYSTFLAPCALNFFRVAANV